ncbi:hypothetical protein HanIR_Chr10g0472451 [Helianthus annuus]|nr:hypothetical protein HanIR_Chr10g0472451 [Helianthus annuus]
MFFKKILSDPPKITRLQAKPTINCNIACSERIMKLHKVSQSLEELEFKSFYSLMKRLSYEEDNVT